MKKININQIYHTSHCGSTLMATLLTGSAVVYCEPPWTQNILLNDDVQIPEDIGNIVIKWGSGWCPFSNKLPGQKVFLYRKLKQHLFKIKSYYMDNIISTKYENHLNHCHSSIKEYQPKTHLEKIAFMWLNNVTWLKEVDDVLWLESNSFFKNKKETMDLVCDHFELNPINNFELSNVYVKSFGLIGKETPINQVEIPNLGESKSLYPSYGIIEDDMCNLYSEIGDIVLEVKERFPNMDVNLLE
jgi:hypothetical protein